MKTIFISGFRWSGSSAATELIESNFSHKKVPGEEFVPVNLGLLAMCSFKKRSIFRYFLAPYFLDPKNYFKKVSPIRFFLIRISISVLSLRKDWLNNYPVKLSEMLSEGYVNNNSYRCFLDEVYREPLLDNVSHIAHLVMSFINLVRTDASDVIIANNCIPGFYTELLTELSRMPYTKVVTVERNVNDQAKEIKKYSSFGVARSLKSIEADIVCENSALDSVSSGSSVLNLKFEGLVIDSVYREHFLEVISEFLDIQRESYSYDVVKDSINNISAEAKSEYLNTQKNKLLLV